MTDQSSTDQAAATAITDHDYKPCDHEGPTNHSRPWCHFVLMPSGALCAGNPEDHAAVPNHEFVPCPAKHGPEPAPPVCRRVLASLCHHTSGGDDACARPGEAHPVRIPIQSHEVKGPACARCGMRGGAMLETEPPYHDVCLPKNASAAAALSSVSRMIEGERAAAEGARRQAAKLEQEVARLNYILAERDRTLHVMAEQHAQCGPRLVQVQRQVTEGYSKRVAAERVAEQRLEAKGAEVTAQMDANRRKNERIRELEKELTRVNQWAGRMKEALITRETATHEECMRNEGMALSENEARCRILDRCADFIAAMRNLSGDLHTTVRGERDPSNPTCLDRGFVMARLDGFERTLASIEPRKVGVGPELTPGWKQRLRRLHEVARSGDDNAEPYTTRDLELLLSDIAARAAITLQSVHYPIRREGIDFDLGHDVATIRALSYLAQQCLNKDEDEELEKYLVSAEEVLDGAVEVNADGFGG